MKKIKTIVCGTKFGQYYIESLSKKNNDYELLGILSQGSHRSEKCAELYGTKLYKDINYIPEDVDLAIVVIRTSVMGGSGTDLIIKLLRKGINVIVEQPMHEKDIKECLKEAINNNVLFIISNIYKHMKTIKRYKRTIKDNFSCTGIKHIDVFVTNQILFSAIELLEDIYSEDLIIDNPKVICGTQQQPVINGRIGNTSISIKVGNEIDDLDPDNFISYMLNIQTYIDEGVFELYDVFGPIIWKPMINVAHNLFIENEDSGELKSKTIYIEKCYSEFDFKYIFSHYWINSIASVLDEFKLEFERSSERKIIIRKKYQKFMENAALWREITSSIGYPVVKKSVKRKSLMNNIFYDKFTNLSEFNLEENMEMQYTWNDIKITNIILETACIESVYYKIFESIVLDDNKKIDISKIYELSDNEINKKRILTRWLSILEKEKYISINNGEVKFNIDITREKVNYNWTRAKKILIPNFTNEDVLDYYIESGQSFIGILSGEIDPMLLMFPNGEDSKAEKFYRQNIMERLIAEEIVRHVNQYINNTKEKIRILELGAGTGATSEYIFSKSNLTKNNCEYIFSDISEYFLNKASLKFDNSYIKYKKIDFNKSLINQGIESKSIDILISAGALNNAINTHDVIDNIYNVLKDSGIFLIAEPTGDHYEIALSQSFLMNIPNDERYISNSTFFTLNQWMLALKEKDLVSRNICYWPEKTNPLWGLKKYLLYVKKEF